MINFLARALAIGVVGFGLSVMIGLFFISLNYVFHGVISLSQYEIGAALGAGFGLTVGVSDKQ